MEQIVLNGITRTTSGKGQARALRRSGRIPAVVYGHSEPISFSVEAREFHKEFHTVSESQLITLKLEKRRTHRSNQRLLGRHHQRRDPAYRFF